MLHEVYLFCEFAHSISCCFELYFYHRCPKSNGDDTRAPTMCLVCGQMLCSQSYCCQTELDGVKVGAATEHSYKCGAGVGIFLRFVQVIYNLLIHS